jgi:hypothetical protein
MLQPLSIRYLLPVVPALYSHKHFCSLLIALIVTCLYLLLYSPLVYPDQHNSGTYTGTVSGTESCPTPPTTDTFSGTVTLNITQSGSSFTGSGSSSILHPDETGPPDPEPISNLSGSIDTAGNVNGTFQIVEPTVTINFTFSGTLIGNTLSISGTWADDGPPNCTGTFSATLTRAGGDVIVDPEITPSNVLTAPLLLNLQVKAITANLNTRIGDVLRGIAIGPRQTASGFMWQGLSGLNAGDRMINYGIWGSYSYSDFENDFVSTAFDGHRHSFLAGFDISPWENTVFGVALGYEGSDIDTGFNSGNEETDGYTIAPYAGYLLSENWSIDASVGFSWIDSDQFRTDPGTGDRITSSPSADRWFGTFNVNGFTSWRNWFFGSRIGILHAENKQESFTESDGTFRSSFTNKLSQWNIGGDVAYSFGQFEPFARVTYEHDFSMTEIAVTSGPQPSNDNDNFLFGAGLRYFGRNGLSANLEWNKRVDRDDFDEDTFSFTARMDF